MECEFNESEYRAVRDRQMKELELEDDLLNKVPVRYVLQKFSREVIIFETRKSGISALSCIKNHTNLSDNNVYNASFKVPGLLLLCPRIRRGKSSVVRADPGDSCV